MAGNRRELDGIRILIVEDMLLVAETMKLMLEERGSDVVGPVARVGAAMKLVGATTLDGAVLDINLAGELCFPIAQLLSERDIPFIFVTGYDDASVIPPEFQARPKLTKPVEETKLIAAATRHFGHAARA